MHKTKAPVKRSAASPVKRSAASAEPSVSKAVRKSVGSKRRLGMDDSSGSPQPKRVSRPSLSPPRPKSLLCLPLAQRLTMKGAALLKSAVAAKEPRQTAERAGAPKVRVGAPKDRVGAPKVRVGAREGAPPPPFDRSRSGNLSSRPSATAARTLANLDTKRAQGKLKAMATATESQRQPLGALKQLQIKSPSAPKSPGGGTLIRPAAFAEGGAKPRRVQPERVQPELLKRVQPERVQPELLKRQSPQLAKRPSQVERSARPSQVARSPKQQQQPAQQASPKSPKRSSSVGSSGSHVSPSSKPARCSKCDGPHPSDRCPHYKKSRDTHPDAQPGKAGRNGMGHGGRPILLRRGRVMPQPGDGSCLFHSLRYGLAQQRGSVSGHLPNAHVLRRQLAEWVATHAQLRIADTPLAMWVRWDTGLSPRAYAARMGRSGWGGGIEMAACSHLMGINVWVYEKCSGGFERISCFDAPTAKGESKRGLNATIHILYQGGVHYDALVPEIGELQAALARAAKEPPRKSPKQKGQRQLISRLR